MSRKKVKTPLPAFRTDRIPMESPPVLTTKPVEIKEGSASAGRMGMWLFLASLGVLFTACLVGYLVVRLRAPEWPPPGSPSLPIGIWASTAVLIVLSALMILAERAAERGRRETATRMLTASLILAIAFLGSQVANWMRLAADGVMPHQSLFVFGFYILTFLHAAHVFGGLVPLILVTLRTRAGKYMYGASEGVHLVAMYWHFLGITWLAILVVLFV
jgi:cytochrome c oxidase subunit 3